MSRLVAISEYLDLPSRFIGRWLRWLAAALVVVQFAVVVLRYVFASTFTMLHESVIYIHATLFMCAAAYTFLADGHVRVDIFYAAMSRRSRAIIDLFGICLGIFPLCILIVWFGWPYVTASWRIMEGALFFGGIPAVYLLKTLILVFPILLFIQALSIALRSIATIHGHSVSVFTGTDDREQP